MRIEKEFGAHTWGICSTHEHYKTVEYQLQTPTGSGRTRKSLPSQVHLYLTFKKHAYMNCSPKKTRSSLVSNFQTVYKVTSFGKSQIRVQKSRLSGGFSTDLNVYRDRITELRDRASQSWGHVDFPRNFRKNPERHFLGNRYVPNFETIERLELRECILF